MGCVRWSVSDPSNQDKCQNKLLRALNGTRVSDKISTKSLLTKLNMLSVNQINAQIKLTEMWKSIHITNYPIKSAMIQRNDDVVSTRAISSGLLKEAKLSNMCQRTNINDATHIWNLAPLTIKNCASLSVAKKS